MIKGIGTDLLEKKRVEKSISKFGDKFIKKVLTEKEQKEYQAKKTYEKKVSFLSNNFACKEAVSKALGTGFSEGITLKNIEVLRESGGNPCLQLKGKAKEKALECGFENFTLSISDTKDHSLALVIGEGK
jgi:holo-[acyl-carrier protein] synthase